MEPSEPKWDNSVLNIMGVNTLRLWGLQLMFYNIRFIELIEKLKIKTKFEILWYENIPYESQLAIIVPHSTKNLLLKFEINQSLEIL